MTTHGKDGNGINAHQAGKKLEAEGLCIESELPLTKQFMCSSCGTTTHEKHGKGTKNQHMAKNLLAAAPGTSTHREKNGHGATTHMRETAVKGTLLYCANTLVDDDSQQSIEKETLFHIVITWNNIFRNGWATSTRELLLQWSRVNWKPLALPQWPMVNWWFKLCMGLVNLLWNAKDIRRMASSGVSWGITQQ